MFAQRYPSLDILVPFTSCLCLGISKDVLATLLQLISKTELTELTVY